MLTRYFWAAIALCAVLGVTSLWGWSNYAKTDAAFKKFKEATKSANTADRKAFQTAEATCKAQIKRASELSTVIRVQPVVEKKDAQGNTTFRCDCPSIRMRDLQSK